MPRSTAVDEDVLQRLEVLRLGDLSREEIHARCRPPESPAQVNEWIDRLEAERRIIAIPVPVNGVRPASISYATIPTAY